MIRSPAVEDRDTVDLGTIYWVPNDGTGTGMAIGTGTAAAAAVRSLSLGKYDYDYQTLSDTVTPLRMTIMVTVI